MAEHAVDVVDDLAGVVVGQLAGPAGADALRPVHQHHGDDGDVPLGLHLLVVVVQELEQVGVHGREQQPGQGAAGGEGWSGILTLLGSKASGISDPGPHLMITFNNKE